MTRMTRREVQELLAICKQADDQDTGSLDAFREAATVGVVAKLCESWLAVYVRDDDRIDAAGLDWGEVGVPLGDRTAGIGPAPIDEGGR